MIYSILINNNVAYDDAYIYSKIFVVDYNWWGNNATNYNIAPQNSINKWYYLNMTANNNIATLSLNNLYDNATNSIQKDNNCKLPEIDFTLTGDNAKFTQNKITVNNSSNIEYIQYNENASLTAIYLTASITVNINNTLSDNTNTTNNTDIGNNTNIENNTNTTNNTDMGNNTNIENNTSTTNNTNIENNTNTNNTSQNTNTPTQTKKQTPKITAKKATFKSKKKSKKYTITLKAGKKAVKKVQVTLKIKGKKYNKTFKAKTNNKGKAIFKIKKLTKKGKYTATITFKGNQHYNKANKKVKIIVK